VTLEREKKERENRELVRFEGGERKERRPISLCEEEREGEAPGEKVKGTP